MILWERLGAGNKKELPLGMCVGAAQRKFLWSWQWEPISVEMFPARINVFSATEGVAGKQAELDLFRL